MIKKRIGAREIRLYQQPIWIQRGAKFVLINLSVVLPSYVGILWVKEQQQRFVQQLRTVSTQLVIQHHQLAMLLLFSTKASSITNTNLQHFSAIGSSPIEWLTLPIQQSGIELLRWQRANHVTKESEVSMRWHIEFLGYYPQLIIFLQQFLQLQMDILLEEVTLERYEKQIRLTMLLQSF